MSQKYGTPTAAIGLLIVVQALLIAASEWTEVFALPELPQYFSLFAWCATFGGFALIVVYFLMSIGAIKGLADDPAKGKLMLAVIIGLITTSAAIFGSFYKVPSPTVLAPWFALAWFVLGLVVMFAVKGREPASQALADLTSSDTT